MSEQRSNNHDAEGSQELSDVHPDWDGDASSSRRLNIEVAVEVDRENESNHRLKKKSIAERLKMLSANAMPSDRPQSSEIPQPVRLPHYPPREATLSTEQQPLPEPSRLRHRFGANLPVIETWIAAGSLHGFPEEDILLRCSGYVTDCLNIYNLYTYVMLTPTRIVVKEASTFFKFNLYTTEASYRYKDVRHVSVERVTQFKFLWAAISLFSLGIILLALSGINIVACALGLVSLFYAIMFLYWFHIYYNAHSVVINFSKDAAVGAWSIPKGKGSYLTKPLLLPVKDCFDVMYKVFDQAKLFKIDEG